jgi:hypothetical protein
MANIIRFISAAALLLAAAALAAVVVEEDFEGAKFPPDGWERVQTRGLWTREHVGAPYNWCAYFYSYGLAGGTGVLRTKGQDIQAGDYRVTFAYSYRTTGGAGGTTAYARVQRQTGATWQLVAAQLLPLSSSFRAFVLGHTANAAGTYRVLFEADAEINRAIYFRVDNVKWETAPSSTVGPASLGRVKAIYN